MQAMSVDAIHRVFNGKKTEFTQTFLAPGHLSALMARCVRDALDNFEERPEGVKFHVWVQWHIRLALQLAKTYSGVPATTAFLNRADDDFVRKVVPVFTVEAGHLMETRRDRDVGWREEVTQPSIPLPTRPDGRAMNEAPETVMTPAAARWTVTDMLNVMK